MEVLPEIVEAVGGRAKIMIDGGFCRGTDIVKAMAPGADLVGLGRMQCYALAAAGEAGMVRLLELLEDEVQRCLGLLGVATFAELDRSYLHRGRADHAAACPERIPAAQDRRLSLLISRGMPRACSVPVGRIAAVAAFGLQPAQHGWLFEHAVGPSRAGLIEMRGMGKHVLTRHGELGARRHGIHLRAA